MEEALCLLLDIERYVSDDTPKVVSRLEATISQLTSEIAILEQENAKLLDGVSVLFNLILHN